MGRRSTAYWNGDVRLGKSGGWFVADFDDGGTRKRTRLVEAKVGERDARARLDKFAEARRAVRKQQSSHTVEDLWDLWMKDREKDGFSNDIYQAQWVSLGAWFGPRSPDLITTDDCREYARSRFDAGRAPATVNTELSRLRGCLKWAHDERLIKPPPRIWTPQAGKPRDRVLSPDEARSLLAAARHGDPHVWLFTVLLFATSGRHKAILDLTWGRVDLHRGIIELDETLPPDPMHKNWRKGRASIAMSALARAALEDANPGRQTDHVIEHGGKRLKSVRDGFANAVKRAGLGWDEEHPETGEPKWTTDVTPHTIRHTIASWARGRVATTFTAQLLGHRDEATTRKVYTHVNVEDTRQVVDVIDAMIAALPEKREIEAIDMSGAVEIEPISSKIDKSECGDA